MSNKKDLVPFWRLKGYYAERGITYTEEAKRLGITLSAFSRKINRQNGYDFTREESASICKAHGLDANEFFLD